MTMAKTGGQTSTVTSHQAELFGLLGMQIKIRLRLRSRQGRRQVRQPVRTDRRGYRQQRQSFSGCGKRQFFLCRWRQDAHGREA